jgi:hypothetical protein
MWLSSRVLPILAAPAKHASADCCPACSSTSSNSDNSCSSNSSSAPFFFFFLTAAVAAGPLRQQGCNPPGQASETCQAQYQASGSSNRRHNQLRPWCWPTWQLTTDYSNPSLKCVGPRPSAASNLRHHDHAMVADLAPASCYPTQPVTSVWPGPTVHVLKGKVGQKLFTSNLLQE